MNQLFGSVKYSSEVNEYTLQAMLEKALSQKPTGLFILCCEQSLNQLNSFESFLQSIPIPVFGGAFPSVLYDQQAQEQGIIFVAMHMPLDIRVFHDLDQAKAFELSFNLAEYQSLIVLVDGLSRNIEDALNQIFLQTDSDIAVFGGGAGSLSFQQKPCIFTNQGVFDNTIVMVAMQLKVSLAIGHGWQPLAGPYLANQVDDNHIVQLNFQPALEVYQQVVEEHSGKKFSDHEFFDLAKTYPFGIERLDDDLLVRESLTFEETSLVCVGRVPENVMLYILGGQPQQLINAAANAVEIHAKKSTISQAMLFDCAGRKLFLADEFDSELEQITSSLNSKNKLFGALVLGEIASGQCGGIHFHNKTAVIAMTKDDQ
ncbi:FIST signal transduction protein [Paraglaciecola sp. L3A3]|uniref:FIST signal transduction protein n=1 Tax=Paraglaciecola sp. L3A3 TaxID=2686358 RepID=UPI00131BDA5E|nr:FIST C-terminal domain-containing protein [Paraglaciecola sp. L3A3]